MGGGGGVVHEKISFADDLLHILLILQYWNRGYHGAYCTYSMTDCKHQQCASKQYLNFKDSLET